MNNHVLLGSYVPVQSVLHHLDPRSKLLTCLIFVIDCFCVNNPITGVILALALLGAMMASHVSPSAYWDGIRAFLWVIIITVLCQLLFSSGGHVFWSAGPMAITSDGLVNSVYIIYRFVMTILAATVLTATTTAMQLSLALTWFLQPLKKLHCPIDQFSLMMAISLQFIPILSAEYHRILAAQISRGANFNGGGWRHLRQLMPLLVPLLVSTFNRASDLATAMEARGYVPGAPRTSYRRLNWQRSDTFAMLLVVMVTVLMVVVQTIG